MVAEKFFTIPNVIKDGASAVFCEKDYFKKLKLTCARCGHALRGPYVKIGKKKFHLEHFSYYSF
jgi:hypothetical protein